MRKLTVALVAFVLLFGGLGQSAGAQNGVARSGGPVLPAPKPEIVQGDGSVTARNTRRENIPAKKLFGSKRAAAGMTPASIGFYAKGCLAGGEQMPINGTAWQAMRLSRNRNWGHPRLVALLKKFATEAKQYDGWPGLLVGDMSQPRGGPMLTGHRSHQIGLDADIWFTPMPDRRLTREEREKISATSMSAKGGLSVDPKRWTKSRVKIIKRIASYGQVQRILVHPAIKKALCEGAGELGGDRSWLNKVRLYWGHHYHFHVRLYCPPGSAGCRPQAATPTVDTCGDELKHWYTLLTRPAKPKPKAKPEKKPVKKKPRREMTLAQLPQQCRAVLDAPSQWSKSVPIPVPAKRVGK